MEIHSYMKSCVFITVKMWKKTQMSITWMIDLKKNVAYVRKWIIIKQQKTVATNNIIQHG